jgi:hypothetical protein
MYYNEKQHNRNKTYKEDKIKWSSKEYKPNSEFENDILTLKDEDYKNNIEVIEYKIQYISPVLVQKTTYQEDYSRRGFEELYDWFKSINTVSAAILAEIISAPKLNPSIEKVRPQVKQMKTISIQDYKKIKCLGTTRVNWLKDIKKKYGINVLRFLYTSI